MSCGPLLPSHCTAAGPHKSEKLRLAMIPEHSVQICTKEGVREGSDSELLAESGHSVCTPRTLAARGTQKGERTGRSWTDGENPKSKATSHPNDTRPTTAQRERGRSRVTPSPPKPRPSIDIWYSESLVTHAFGDAAESRLTFSSMRQPPCIISGSLELGPSRFGL